MSSDGDPVAALEDVSMVEMVADFRLTADAAVAAEVEGESSDCARVGITDSVVIFPVEATELEVVCVEDDDKSVADDVELDREELVVLATVGLTDSVVMFPVEATEVAVDAEMFAEELVVLFTAGLTDSVVVWPEDAANDDVDVKGRGVELFDDEEPCSNPSLIAALVDVVNVEFVDVLKLAVDELKLGMELGLVVVDTDEVALVVKVLEVVTV